MFSSLLDYVCTDLYAKVFLASIMEARGEDFMYDPSMAYWLSKVQIDPELLASVDETEIPDTLVMTGLWFSLDEEGVEFAGSPSLAYDKLCLSWHQPNDISDNHRLVGPARIDILNAVLHYQDAAPHRKGLAAVSCDSVKFQWFQEGKPKRKDGPYSVILRNLEVFFEHGRFVGLNQGHTITLSWKTEAGRTLPEDDILASIKQNQLDVNPYGIDHYFRSSADAMRFWADFL